MIFELTPDAFQIVKPLYGTPYLEYVINAMIAMNTHGRIWVDDLSDPKTAVMWDEGPRFYFTGREDNHSFNESLGQMVQRIMPALGSYMVVYYDAPHWEGMLSDILSNRPLHRAQRCIYKLDSMLIPDWHGRLHEDFTILPINRQLLSKSGIANIDSLVSEIQSTWPSIDRFIDNGFGFCALHGGDGIVCWCTGEYANGNHIGVGIETITDYRLKSLATLTASAFAEHCISKGIEAHWDCWLSNTPSIRVAEKVGFRKIMNYDVCEG